MSSHTRAGRRIVQRRWHEGARAARALQVQTIIAQRAAHALQAQRQLTHCRRKGSSHIERKTPQIEYGSAMQQFYQHVFAHPHVLLHVSILLASRCCNVKCMDHHAIHCFGRE